MKKHQLLNETCVVLIVTLILGAAITAATWNMNYWPTDAEDY